MSMIGEKSAEVQNLLKNNEIKFDPLALAAIVQLFMELISMFTACKTKPVEAIEEVRSGGLLVRNRLHRIIRDHPNLGIRLKKELKFAMLKICETLTDEEVTQMFEEAAA